MFSLKNLARKGLIQEYSNIHIPVTNELISKP